MTRQLSFARKQRLRLLVRKLRGLQHDRGLTLTAMSDELGISTSLLSMVYSGQRIPGRKFLRGVIRAYPQLHNEVYLFLANDTAAGERYVAYR